ncbi:MAG TPA: glycine betaine ABC transporter substrate-binding protein [Terriglobia bacterium]|nr:glycine betaine ABC transporter substrate-binding protein [Terriglobia bacterium]
MKTLLAALITPVLVLAACGGNKPSHLVIGSKNFTEQTVLAELLAQHIESKLGVLVDRRVNLGGTLICHEAVKSGQIDLYVEYTGTALTAVLHEESTTDPAEARRRVTEDYGRQFNLEVTEPLGFDNSFAIVIRGDDARRLNLHSLSDIAEPARQWRAGFGYEFMERPDGFPGLARAYNLKFARDPLLMDLGLLYRALDEKQVDLVAGNATDGVIAARGFVVLQDDQRYFPPYEAVPIVNREALQRFPALRDALAALAGKITAEDMRRLNYAVDGEHRDAQEVVREFLAERKL